MKKKAKKSRHRFYYYTDKFRVMRTDKADGSKTFCTQHLSNGRWVKKAPPKPWPLYKPDEVVGEDTVIVAEGEKCAEVLRDHGFCATTSATGSSSPQHTDWSPLAGKTVIIIPDNDDPGRVYRDKVANLLAKLDPPVDIKAVDTSSWVDGHDIADIVADAGGAE